MKNLYITILALFISFSSFAQVGAILGNPAICAPYPGTTALTDTTAGGSWSSSNLTIATVGASSGVVTGIIAGTAAISYTVSGVTVAQVVTVNPDPGPISGVFSICVGSTQVLTDAISGGTWSNACTSGLAIVSDSFGVVEGLAAGTCIVTYTLGSGCGMATTAVTVYTTPPITSPPAIECLGSTFTLTDAISGGTWSSSNTAVVTVGGSGVLDAVGLGTSTLTYTDIYGCTATTMATVNPTPAAISTGSTTICEGLCTLFSDATGGGVWSSSNTAVGVIGSTTGIMCTTLPGYLTVYYYLGTGCSASISLTINPNPEFILGGVNICEGNVTALTDPTTGGTWSSGNTAIALVGSTTGVTTGEATGTTHVTYTLTSTGCISTALVTVGPDAILGEFNLCLGSSTNLFDSSGGAWSCSNADVSIGTSGTVTGLIPGTSTITSNAGTYCVATAIVTVNATPPTMTIAPNPLCVAGTASLSDSLGGGTWSSSNALVASITVLTSALSGNSVGTANITYTLATGCYTSSTATVEATSSTITGPDQICGSSSITLSDATTGGTWSSSSSSAAVTISTGIVTGVSLGTSTIIYYLSSGGCAAYPVTVDPVPSLVSGPSSLCIGIATLFSDATAGGVWSISSGSATIGSASGIVLASGGSSATISYTFVTGCYTTTLVTIDALPAITASATGNCGCEYSLSAGGGVTYSWAPSSGLSCSTCSSASGTVTATTTYTVTGTNALGCANTDTVTINGNRISGFFTMTVTPTDTLKVWLIQFNTTDSVLTAEDSAYSCMDGTTPYYEFDNEPAGSYMVKAKLLSSVAGTSGYVPTYGLSTAYWDTATTITHTGATDTQHINMIYGTVPAGPGFIGGLISSGAGRGTSGGAPVVGMLVYLENAAGSVLTYTYTNSTGNYSFSGLAYNTYTIYPVNYRYTTTPDNSITLTASADSFTAADFYQNTTHFTITPTLPLLCCTLPLPSTIMVYPNPAANELNIKWVDEQPGNATLTITDITGQVVYRSVLNMAQASGSNKVNLSGLASGTYLVNIKSASINYNNKIEVAR